MTNTTQIMSEYKFIKDYAKWRPEDNRYENWSEAVDRVMDMHHTKYQDKIEGSSRLRELIEYATEAYKDKLILASQRSLQFGGEPTLIKNERMYNCFHKNEEFVTTQGVKSFNDCIDGDIVKVRTHTGAWKDAVVRNYGRQTLNRVVLGRGTNETEVLVTGNHRWILKDGTETDSLKVGDALLKTPNNFKDFDFDHADPLEKLYWCYGFVYGDGTVNNTHSMLRLCGKDTQFEHRFLEMGFKSSSSASLQGDVMVYTGKYKKTSPDPEKDSPEIIRAFVAGYLQADGCKSGNWTEGKMGTRYNSIQSSQEDHIEFIRKCFPIAGVYIISEQDLTGQETNYGVRPTTISFIVIDSLDSPSAAIWRVKSITHYGEDDVWCLEVEDDHSFVMPNGVVTGNCLTSYCDRPIFFQEAMHWLLCGGGVGFSVQKHHVAKIPALTEREEGVKTFQVPDTIEGWSDAFGVLLSSFLSEGNTFPEYKGYRIDFDFSLIRPEGSLISGGFKAPGPDGLRTSLIKVEEILVQAAGRQLKPIEAYDVVMHMSDAVLSGGVRRSATICLFSPDDKEMLNAKIGDWYIKNPQRGRSNNSALLVRGQTSRETFDSLFESVKQFGEPGIVWAESTEVLYNPCVEIGFIPVSPVGESAWQGCNLCEINGGQTGNRDKFFRAIKAATTIGTLQAGFTQFNYCGQETTDTFEHEALLGVSITGWMENPKFLFDEELLREGAEYAKEVNREMAALIGINPAARITCTKPSGNASVLLGTSSGIHPHHAKRYFRNMQGNRNEDVVKAFAEANPKAIETSVWNPSGKDLVLSFPITAPRGSKFKDELEGIKLLDYVKLAQNSWVEYGTNVDLCNHPKLRHNISNTITVDDWDEVQEYVWENQDYFAGISFLSQSGDKDYAQAPFTEVKTAEEILEQYGTASLLASGLIVDALHAFSNDLWLASATLFDEGVDLSIKSSENALQRDWVRRASKFARRYFKNDLKQMTYCLKDVHLLHKWEAVSRSFKAVDWENADIKPTYTDVNTTGAVACSGGVCEIG